MCILFLAINRHPKYSLVVAANRDEQHDRPSRSMHYWTDHPDIYAGRDLNAGGSWLGVNRSGDFCAVTNFRTGKPARPGALSRGQLVKDYLACEDKEPFIAHLQKDYHRYNPFNLVFGDSSVIRAFCSESAKLTQPGDGFHSISNGHMDELWPKMSVGVTQLADLVTSDRLEISRLNVIMQDQSKAEPESLPRTGVSQKLEQHLSSIFICGEHYGTRTTSYLMFGPGHIDIQEINYDRAGNVTDQQEHQVVVNR